MENNTWEKLDKLRGRWKFNEVRNTILKTIKNKEERELNEEIVQELDLRSKTTDELINLFYSLKDTSFENIFYFNESLENLALEIFRKNTASNSILDLGSGVGHMLYKAAQEYKFKDLEGEEINPDSIEISNIILDKLDVKKKILNVDSTLNFKNTKKYDAVFMDALFLNTTKKQLEEIEKKAGNDLIKTRGPILEWVFVNRILKNLNEDGLGIMVIRDSALTSDFNTDIRKKLVEEGLVKAVIQLPGNIIEYTSISTSILVLSKKENDAITFIDASNEFETKNRYQAKFNETNINAILNTFGKNTDISCVISKAEIRKKHYVLNAKRYVNSIVDNLINPVSLTSLVDVIRGRDISKKTLDDDKSNNKAGYLINLSDIQDYNISLPQQEISTEILEKYKNFKVKPLDIIITSRGSAFKVAIVNEELTDNNMIISSNLNILRVRDSNINPYYVLSFLTSQFAKEQIEQLSSGSVINVISKKSLDDFQVSLLNQEEQEEIAKEMEETIIDYTSYLEKINKLQSDIKSLFEKALEV